MGTMLQKKLIVPFVTDPARSNALRKPVLVIIITDGEPMGELQFLSLDSGERQVVCTPSVSGTRMECIALHLQAELEPRHHHK